MVTRGEPDVIEVVMLAAGAEAFLDSDGTGVIALLGAEEKVFKLL